MGMINQLMAPIRSIVRFPLFQFAVVVFLILWLQAGDEASMRGYIFNGIDRLVETTVSMAAAIFTVKSFTRTWLTSGFWIAYVYIACLLILSLARFAIGLAADFAARRNIFWLRNSIARERGIVAYRAWVPFERIRPAEIPQPYGKRPMRGPPTIDRLTVLWRNGLRAARLAMPSQSSSCLVYCKSSRHFRF